MEKTKINRRENKLTWRKRKNTRIERNKTLEKNFATIKDCDVMKLHLKIKNTTAKIKISIE